jgi:hypothetical protein
MLLWGLCVLGGIVVVPFLILLIVAVVRAALPDSGQLDAIKGCLIQGFILLLVVLARAWQSSPLWAMSSSARWLRERRVRGARSGGRVSSRAIE